MLKPESWAVIAIALFGITAALFAFLRTPAGQRLRLRPPSVEERLAAAPPEARAVIIRADRRRALRRDLPWFVLLLPVAAFALWIAATRGESCAALFGIGRARVLVATFLLVVPAILVPVIVATVVQALRILRGGYAPPLDTAVYADAVALSGPGVRVRAIVTLVALLVCLGMLAYGFGQARHVLLAKRFWEGIATPPAACTARPR